MSSIRRSLTLYFLGLLALGVGSVAFLADRVMTQTLESRLEASSEALDLRAEERIKEARDKFDQDLLTQARNIGRVMQYQYFHRFERESRKFQCGLVTQLIGAAAMGPLPPAVWSVGMGPSKRSPFGPLSGPVIREYFVNLHLDDHYFRHVVDDERQPEYIQLNTAHGLWRSQGMQGLTLPFRRELLNTDQLITWQFDTVVLPEDHQGRRVILKTPLSLGWIRVPFPRTGTGPPARPFAPPPRANSTDTDPLPNIYIHYARTTGELNTRIARIQAGVDRQKSDLAWHVQWDRRRFRFWLAVIGGVTFLATLFGGPLLIGRGLGPLRRLSDAVSQVSEKDFRLPIQSDQLTYELLPIHARLTATLEALRRAFEHEKQAVADLSHELRTPIAALLTTIDVTLRKPREPEKYKQVLEECRVITKQLGVLVERIMTLAWLDAGKDSQQLETIDVREIAQGCIAVIRPLADSNDITVSTDLNASVGIVTDAGKFREILMNLLHNAIEYNTPHGTLSLSLQPTPRGGAAITIRDTGIGMSLETQDRIFERFYRADSSRTATGVHAGLGLSIVKEYVSLLNGTITVESQPGVGTSFHLTFPSHPHPERIRGGSPTDSSSHVRRLSGDGTMSLRRSGETALPQPPTPS
ncbi:MAG: HAMP domain-containing histidine kinase [Bacteroidales bacterium]|nr:HAMP domain-containing histidine kinase [Bacteroidales bacterium]